MKEEAALEKHRFCPRIFEQGRFIKTPPPVPVTESSHNQVTFLIKKNLATVFTNTRWGRIKQVACCIVTLQNEDTEFSNCCGFCQLWIFIFSQALFDLQVENIKEVSSQGDGTPEIRFAYQILKRSHMITSEYERRWWMWHFFQAVISSDLIASYYVLCLSKHVFKLIFPND